MNQIRKWREGILRELAAKEMAEDLFKDWYILLRKQFLMIWPPSEGNTEYPGYRSVQPDAP